MSTSEEIRAVLLDIEGTTTPISYVFDVLFPYARTRLREHVKHHFAVADYERLFDRLREDYRIDRSSGQPVPSWADNPPEARLNSIVAYIEWLMDRDRKTTPLKELQGRIWEEGYRRGELRAEIFSDVAPALERWTADGLRVGIYSSGSVLAQQLLFTHTAAGDLTRLLTWHFDTTSGAKTDPASYNRIAVAMDIPPHAVLFVSDVTGELDAARTAGMKTRLSIREGNAPAPAGHGHHPIHSLADMTV